MNTLTAVPPVKPFSAQAFDTAEGPGFWHVSVEGASPVKVSSRMLTLMEVLKEPRTIQEVTELLDHEGMQTDEQFIVEAIRKLDEMGMLSTSVAKPPDSVLWLKIRLLRGAHLERIVRPLAWLCHPWVMSLGFAAAFLAIAAYVSVGGTIARPAAWALSRETWSGLALFYATLLWHEVGHGAAASWNGVSIGDSGFGLYLAQPVLYIELTDAWRVTRWRRVQIDLAGIYFQVLAVVPMVVAYIVTASVALELAIQLTLLTVVFNLNPALRFDGFWILTDAIGLVNIHRRALGTIKMLFLRILGRPVQPEYDWRSLTPWIRRIYAIYTGIYALGLLVSVSMALFLLGGWLLGLQEGAPGDRSFLLLVAGALGLQLVLHIARKIKVSPIRIRRGPKDRREVS